MSLYILGSGFSKAAGEPLAKDINHELFQEKSNINSPLYKWIGSHLYNNLEKWHHNATFEEVISRLDLYLHYSNKNCRQRKEIKEIESTLLDLFIQLLNQEEFYNKNTNLYEKFIKILNPEDIVISFNYDLIIEKTIKKLGLKTPDYGFQFNSQGNKAIPLFRFYKLHGSINWSYCPRCKEISIKDISLENNIFPSSDCCQRKPLIITPTLFKSYSIPAFKDLWKKAFKALSIANKIYFIGYSIPRSDALVYQLMDLANFNNSLNPKVYLINGKQPNYERQLSIYSSLINTNLSFEEWIENRYIFIPQDG